jgi:hypothetical protein
MRGALAVALSCLMGAGSLALAGETPSARITYVANEGFLVTSWSRASR